MPEIEMEETGELPVDDGQIDVKVKRKDLPLWRRLLGKLTPAIIFALITVHFGLATDYFINVEEGTLKYTMCDGYGMLVILYGFITYGFAYAYIAKPYLAKPLTKAVFQPLGKVLDNIFGRRLVIWVIYVIIFAAIVVFVVWDSWGNERRLIPAAGLVVFYVFGFICSKHRSMINYHTIIRGFFLQFVFGLITLRWETGRAILDCAGNKVTVFLGYAQNGSAFVYGDFLVFGNEALKQNSIFAFGAISTIYFLGFVINILYHVGIMQKVVVNLGIFLQSILGTSICESVNSAANIFLGQSEAPLLLRPYLEGLTSSEVHAVMTAGFASVSGTVLAAYISFGANPAHLITASVMAAPAGLVYSKLMYPETEPTATKEAVALTKSEFSSVLDAASQGAFQATQIVMGIIANLIAFISSVFFINGMLSWMGALVGFDEPDEIWSIDLFVGYIFTPISYLMGVEWDDCSKVGNLIGLKMMVNEFVAFGKFQELELSPRSKIIATFAICGFANPGSIGIMISALGSLVPKKLPMITSNAFRSYISGSIVCFTTACIAGMLSPD